MQFSSRSPLWRVSAAALPFIAVAALGACGKTNFNPETASAVAVAGDLPEPSASDLYGQSRETRIGPGDKLAIEVLGVTDLERTLIVDGSGAIQFPLVGRVEALGQTPAELSRTLEQRLSAKYLQNPQVTVSVIEAVSQRFTIYGGVNQPGLYPVVGNATLTDAISLYGNDRDSLTQTIAKARYGVMPAWGQRLDPVTVKMLAAYVHSLGGGEAFVAEAPPVAATATNGQR